MDSTLLLGLALCALAAGAVFPAHCGGQDAAPEPTYERLRAPLFGLAVERERGGETHRLVRVVEAADGI
jgi:hypothetical protein